MTVRMHSPVHDVAADRQDADTFLDVLDRSMSVVRRLDVPYLVIGEIGSSIYGRDRGTRDIDLFVRPEAAPRVLEAFGDAGFGTEVVFDHWLFKARRDDVDVDIIFRATRDILLDEEMLERAATAVFRGRELPVAPPEDLLIMKAMATGEDPARYWYDAIAILARTPLDLEYLFHRAAQHGARRILSLLLFATSVDLVVPPSAIEQLFSLLYRGEGGNRD
jgi:predicted nucleotidyltransferase